MTSIFKTQLSKDAANKKIIVVREFAAPVAKVWAAWTQYSLLDQWWAPKPYKIVTKSQDFSVGGTWLYSMVGPDNVPMYALFNYQAIDPGKSYDVTDAFCDEQGNINTDFPSTHWHVVFEPSAAGTKVTVTMSFASEADMNKLIEMGFQEGFTMAHGNLDELLQK
ncbi:MAG: hypothetical protein JWO03_1115 [Bacteroidetes bacterium]|nr:hypothetical protein [Bacteroidota bacterium]